MDLVPCNIKENKRENYIKIYIISITQNIRPCHPDISLFSFPTKHGFLIPCVLEKA